MPSCQPVSLFRKISSRNFVNVWLEIEEEEEEEEAMNLKEQRAYTSACRVNKKNLMSCHKYKFYFIGIHARYAAAAVYNMKI